MVLELPQIFRPHIKNPDQNSLKMFTYLGGNNLVPMEKGFRSVLINLGRVQGEGTSPSVCLSKKENKAHFFIVSVN